MQPWGDKVGGNPGANLSSISHRCYLFDIAFVWELTEDTIVLPLGCLLGGRGGEEEKKKDDEEAKVASPDRLGAG